MPVHLTDAIYEIVRVVRLDSDPKEIVFHANRPDEIRGPRRE